MNEQELFSYAGKILRVNLSNGTIKTEPTATYAKEWLGSSGIAMARFVKAPLKSKGLR